MKILIVLKGHWQMAHAELIESGQDVLPLESGSV
jgi:hypothetical protein